MARQLWAYGNDFGWYAVDPEACQDDRDQVDTLTAIVEADTTHALRSQMWQQWQRVSPAACPPLEDTMPCPWPRTRAGGKLAYFLPPMQGRVVPMRVARVDGGIPQACRLQRTVRRCPVAWLSQEHGRWAVSLPQVIPAARDCVVSLRSLLPQTEALGVLRACCLCQLRHDVL